MTLSCENHLFVLFKRPVGKALVGLLLASMAWLPGKAEAGFLDQVPVFRGAVGIESISFTAGNSGFNNEPLGALFSLRPTVLWDFPTFSSRMGIHFTGTFGSPFGAMPMSGIGFSGYFYPMSVSSAYEITRDGTLFQKSKAGPFMMAMFTPMNFNLNRAEEETPVPRPELTVSAFMIDFALGGGYDYPLSPNMILSAEAYYRTSRAQQSSTKEEINYQGFGISFVFSTSYY